MGHNNQRHRAGKRPLKRVRPKTPVQLLARGARENGLLIAKARQLIEEAPEIRAEKVAALKAAIDQGTYQIDSQKLADLIIAEWLSRR